MPPSPESENAAVPSAPPPAPLRPPNMASALEEITARADTVWTREKSGGPVKVQAVERSALKGAHGRVAIVDGCRTPFAKPGTDLANMDLIDLASVAAAEPVARTAIAEYTTGQSMGESAEKMAKENDISRRAQDEIALLSHHRAAAATADGRLTAQIAPTFPPPRYDKASTQDNGIRADSSLDALAKLRPVFDKRYGTLTAGNSSPLTDGGSAVLLMSEEKAKALGYTPLGYIRSYAFTALNPGDQLLQGPAYAAPAALDVAGLKLKDVDLVEMHEAFAAQILSNMKAFASKRFAQRELNRSEPLGVVDLDRFNVTGGSISIGHPFGATGARVVTQLLYELRRRGQNLGLVTVCAAGGVGFAMVLERE